MAAARGETAGEVMVMDEQQAKGKNQRHSIFSEDAPGKFKSSNLP
nr:hypothetical protein [uncultured Desulfobulbus sp.]